MSIFAPRRFATRAAKLTCTSITPECDPFIKNTHKQRMRGQKLIVKKTHAKFIRIKM